MNALLCEVIGCCYPAQWKRAVSDRHEEYLCSQHYLLLQGYALDQAECYAPLPGGLQVRVVAARPHHLDERAEECAHGEIV